MASTDAINYAHAFGIHSVAAAIVFAILYVPLFAWFLRQSIGRPTYVFIVLTFFCSIRIAGFAMRAALAGTDSAGENLNLLIADEIMFSVGFFGLLYSAYTLVLDRELLSDAPPANGIISRITRNRHLFRIAMVAAMAIGITGAVKASSTTASASDISLGSTLRKASVIIFLVLTVLQAYQTILLILSERSALASHQRDSEKLGVRHGVYILCAISILLLIREVFTTATIGNQAKANNEHFWYPLVAVTEILAVILYATPDLVPPRSELSRLPK